MMKQRLPWLILGAVAIGLAIGASVAATIRSVSQNKVQRLPGKATIPREITLTDLNRELDLEDEAEPGSEFYEFREQLRQAVEERNAGFVASVLPDEGLRIGFSVPRSPEALQVEDPEARIWSLLEKAIATGCAIAENPPPYNTDPATAIWVCPNVTQALKRQMPPSDAESGLSWEVNSVVIVGENVNVRSQPNLSGAAIASLSNQVVKRDPARESESNLNPIAGWTPILLSDDRQGYVYNRYVYSPLDYRLFIGQVESNWQLLGMPGGD
ncbi:SH3 domain-containing protein [Phormidium sp. CCY1219]|uniref:SH3 domain-containing protein n=1 Tax=Phormidium sp. CCY1219 TaxID=2886104 RepID=UPI002D1EB3BD|nr:SH3 domain-containing protein [Phormidium sp. CCY1219]MEB3827605.1 SH3 domain-containing protein [Phormidium sp. CCY1219]